MFGEIGEDFSVELNVFLFEGAHKFTVGSSLVFQGRTDLNVPESFEIILLVFSVREGVFPGVDDCFVCRSLFL